MSQKLVFDKILLPSGSIYYLKDTDARAMISGRNYTAGTAYNAGDLIIYQNDLYRVIKTTSAAQNTGWAAMTLAGENARVALTTVDLELNAIRSAATGIMTYIGATSTTINDGDTTSTITIGGQDWTAGNSYIPEEHLFTSGAVVISGAGNKQKEYVWSGTTWNEFGSTGALKALAFKDSASGSYTAPDGTGSVTFTPNVSDTTQHLKATASDGVATITSTAAAITGFADHTTDSFVKSYPGTTSKLSTTSIKPAGADVSVPNVTSAGTASTWSFTVENADPEKLIISGGNGTAPTLGDAINCAQGGASLVTVATGDLAANGGGASVMTGLGTATTSSAITALGAARTANAATAISLSTQPTISLSFVTTADNTTRDVVTSVTPAPQTESVTVNTTSATVTVS